MILKELCQQLNVSFSGDPELEITHVCGFEEISAGGLAFISDPGVLKALPTPGGVFSDQKKSLNQVDLSVPCAVIVPEGIDAQPYNLIFAADPLALHVQATGLLVQGPDCSCQISKAAHVDPSAVVGPQVTIDPGAVIYPGVKIGRGTVIRANVVVMDQAQIGEDCVIYPNVTIREGSQVGNRVILHPGAVIGSDGYGYFQRSGQNIKIPQVGVVVLDDDVEIGANTCIDRARFTVTKMGGNTKLDNLVHIAHNVEVGPESLITAQSGIAGSTKTGSYLMMGGQSGIRDNLVIGDKVTLLARTLVTGKTNDGETVAGMPSRPYTKWRHLQAMLGQLESLLDRVRGIERFLSGIGFHKSEK